MINKSSMVIAVVAVAVIAVTYTLSSKPEVAQDKSKRVSEHIIDGAIPKIEKAIINGKYKSITIKADKEMETYIQSKIRQDLPLSYQTLSGESDNVVITFHTTLPRHLLKKLPAQEEDQEQKKNVVTKFNFELYPAPGSGGLIVDEVTLLEEQAQAHIKANRLSTPRDDCAMSIVEQIEELGGDASSLRTQIGNRYLILARDWFKKGDRKRGNIYVDKAVIISNNLAQSAEKIKAYKEPPKQSSDALAAAESDAKPVTKSDNKQNGFF